MSIVRPKFRPIPPGVRRSTAQELRDDIKALEERNEDLTRCVTVLLVEATTEVGHSDSTLRWASALIGEPTTPAE